MKILRKMSLVFLILLLLLGVSGCMKNPVEYKEEILNYLKAKYDDEFTVVSAIRETNRGKSDVIRAVCFSKTYPFINFHTYYQLDANDILGKDEVIRLLKEANAYNEDDLKTIPAEIEIYFEDEYANVLYQNKFDTDVDSMKNQANYFFTTVFKTANYYQSAEEASVSLEQYVSNPNYNLYTYHSVFIQNNVTAKERSQFVNDIVKHISFSGVTKQYLLMYFVDPYDVAAIKKDFQDNYAEADDYFSSVARTKSIYYLTVVNGEIVDSEDEMAKLLEGE